MNRIMLIEYLESCKLTLTQFNHFKISRNVNEACSIMVMHPVLKWQGIYISIRLLLLASVRPILPVHQPIAILFVFCLFVGPILFG